MIKCILKVSRNGQMITTNREHIVAMEKKNAVLDNPENIQFLFDKGKGKGMFLYSAVSGP